MSVSRSRVFVLILAVGFLPVAMRAQTAHAIIPGFGVTTPLTDATGYDDSYTHFYELTKIAPPVTSIVGTGTLIETGDDEIEGLRQDISIGFNFNFFTTDYNDLQLDGNGHVYLGTGYDPKDNYLAGNGFGAHPENNDGSIHKNYDGPLIALWWDDLYSIFHDPNPPVCDPMDLECDPNPVVGGIGNVYFETRGEPGSQEFVVEYEGVTSYQNTADPGGYKVSAQMVLHEGTNDITFNYTNFITGTAEQGLAIGIQADSFSYLQYGWFEADDKELPLTVGVPDIGESLLWHPTSLASLKLLEVFIDRVTGEVTMENNSGAPIDIKGYSIVSPDGDGGLDAAAATFDLSDGDPSNWFRLSASDGDDLSEAHLTTGTIAIGESFVFGPGTWLQYHKENVEFAFLDGLGRTIEARVVFAGDAGAGDVPFAPMDLNFDTLVNAQDWLKFKSDVGSNLAGLSTVELYRQSDLDGDGVHGVGDFTIFKKAYDAANGAGAFSAMVAAVPEPSTLALLGLGGAIAFCRRRHRQNIRKDVMSNRDAGDETTRNRTRNGKARSLVMSLVMSVVAILAVPAHGQPPAVTPDSWVLTEQYFAIDGATPVNENHYYVLLDLTRADIPIENSIANLEAEAINMGGHLVTINDAAENEWIDFRFSGELPGTGSSAIATGFTDVAEEGTWLWIAGAEGGEVDPWFRANEDPWWTTAVEEDENPNNDTDPAPGNPDVYSNWRENEPNNSGGAEIGCELNEPSTCNVTGDPEAEHNMRKEYNAVFGDPHFGIWQDYRSNIPNEHSSHPGLIEIIVFAPPIELGLTVDKATGALSLDTFAGETIFDSYSITSVAGALDPAGWNAGNLTSQAAGGGLSADLDTDGDVDGADLLAGQLLGPDPTFIADFSAQYGQTGGAPGDEWEVLNDTTGQLFEAFLGGDETIAPMSSLSIGDGYDTANGAEDLVLTFSLSNGKTFTGTVSYINGSMAASVAVPEPSTMVLVMFAALFGIVTRCRESIQGLLGEKTMKAFCKLPAAAISALLGLAWLVSVAQADFTLERDYRLGYEVAEGVTIGLGVTGSGTWDSHADYTDLLGVSTSAPVYTTITGRPDGGSGVGLAFDGSSQQFVRGRRLGNPGTSVESTFSAGGSVDYFGTEFRGMQFWAKPGAASGAQVLVMDTNQHGVRISDDGFYSMRFAGFDYDTNIPATSDVWHHILVVVPDAGGAMMYIDGVGESAAAPGVYNIEDKANLVLGSNTKGGEGLGQFDGGFKEFYTGTLDDLEMFVLGKNQLGTLDFGTFDFTTDNNYIVSLNANNIPTNPLRIPTNPLDINGDLVVSGDGTGPAGTDDVTAFVDNWLVANRHNGVVFPDLFSVTHGDINFDGITDLADWSLLNAENPAMGAAALRLITAVPEPGSCLLMVVGGLLGLPALRRRARRS